MPQAQPPSMALTTTICEDGLLGAEEVAIGRTAHLKADAVAAVGPQEDVGTREEGLEGVGRQVDSIVSEAVHARGHADVDGGEAGARERDDVEEAEVAEGGDERHQQGQRAPHDCPPPAPYQSSGVREGAALEIQALSQGVRCTSW